MKSRLLNSREIPIIDYIGEAAYFHFASHLSWNQLLTYYIQLDSSTVICWTSSFVILGVLSVFCSFYSIFDGKSVSNSEDSDQMPHYAASDLGLDCLQRTLLRVSR